MKDQVSILHEKGVKAVVLGAKTSVTETRESSEGKDNLMFASPEVLFDRHRSTIVVLKNKILAVFIDEVHCAAKWLVFLFKNVTFSFGPLTFSVSLIYTPQRSIKVRFTMIRMARLWNTWSVCGSLLTLFSQSVDLACPLLKKRFIER